MARRLSDGAAVVFDAAILLLFAAIVAILATGGGVFSIGDVRVRAQTIRNPLIALTIAAALRLVISNRPLLLVWTAVTPDRVQAWSARTVERLSSALAAIAAPAARRVVLAAIAASLIIKLANIAWYRGFFSGDDVEVHEMTLGLLFGRAWPIWDLRSAVFPIGIIYPAQWLLAGLGATDTTLLIAAGRVIVALFSSVNIWLVWTTARRQWNSVPIAVIAAVLLAASGLHIQFGSSELPRAVASTFVLIAYGLLLHHTPSSKAASNATVRAIDAMRGAMRTAAASPARVLAAGAAIGIGGALRFSEILFVVPAAATLAAHRARGRTIVAALAALAAFAAAIGVADWLYWGTPAASARSIVQYTLVDRLSSRGYEPWHHYLSHALQWTNPFVLLAAALAVPQGERRLAAWIAAPILLLSALPHKEPRYLLPVLPFLSMLAARGAWLALQRIRFGSMAIEPGTRHRQPRVALAFVGLALVSLLLEADRYRFRRPVEPIRVAQYLAQQQPRAVAIEQAWRAGGHLYLQDAQVIDLPQHSADDVEGAASRLCADTTIEWMAIVDDSSSPALVDRLARCGWIRAAASDGFASYELFRRGTPPRS